MGEGLEEEEDGKMAGALWVIGAELSRLADR